VPSTIHRSTEPLAGWAGTCFVWEPTQVFGCGFDAFDYQIGREAATLKCSYTNQAEQSKRNRDTHPPRSSPINTSTPSLDPVPQMHPTRTPPCHLCLKLSMQDSQLHLVSQPASHKPFQPVLQHTSAVGTTAAHTRYLWRASRGLLASHLLQHVMDGHASPLSIPPVNQGPVRPGCGWM
jgi:hypothetical protein